MSVTKTLRGLGNWSIALSDRMPAEVWDAIDYFGHVTIHTGRVDPRVAGDSLLRSARYVGVLRSRSQSGLPKQIGGLDVAMWLGDPDDKGDIVEDMLTVSGDLLTVVNAVMSGYDAVTIGTVFNVAGPFTQSFQFQSRRTIIDYITQTFPGTNAWRVNGDATLDVGPETSLFVTDPQVLVTRRRSASASSEVDMFLRSLLGELQTNQDVEDLTSRVLLMAQGLNGQFTAAAVDVAPGTYPYLDLHGNPIKMTRIVQESETDPDNAEARAQLQLNRFLGTRDALTLSTEFWDIQGEVNVGDYLWVYDPSMGLVDDANEQIFRGQRMNPLRLQMTETTWPITRGMSVCYRGYDGTWVDLTDYCEWETGATTIVVGGYNRALSSGGAGSFPINTPPDTSVPGVPTWNEPFLVSTYQSPSTGIARGDVVLSWNQPLNEDGSVILDGSHYEIRYRRATIPDYDVTFDMIENMGLTQDQLEATDATFDHMIFFGETDWMTAVQSFDNTTIRIQELVPAMPYEVQIRAIDLANPQNRGDWSDLALFTTTKDNIPPVTPAPPIIASNPLYVQMSHLLGASSGGTFNLDSDLHHLELHGGPEPLFTPDDTTLLGRAVANYGTMIAQVPVVQTFSIANLDPVYYKVIAVDEAGNKSLPSTAVQMTVGLIDEQYISSLTASKITAGTLDASVIVGGRIATMPNFGFPGVELTSQGIEGWNTSGFRSLFWDSTTGRLHVNGDGGIEIQDGALLVRNAAGNVILELGECADGRHGLQVYKDDGTRVLRAGELASSGGDGIEVLSDTGALVRISALAFGMNAATLTGVAATSLTSYNGNTPSCSVEVGNTGRALVHMSCWILPGTNASGDIMGATASFFGSGPGGASVAAADAQGLSAGGDNFGIGRSYLVTGLTPGTWTFSMTYRAGSGTTTNAQFFNRHIAVQPF